MGVALNGRPRLAEPIVGALVEVRAGARSPDRFPIFLGVTFGNARKRRLVTVLDHALNGGLERGRRQRRIRPDVCRPQRGQHVARGLRHGGRVDASDRTATPSQDV